MKKVALIVFALGVVLLAGGIFLLQNNNEPEKNVFSPSVHTGANKEDISLILDHLKIKYNEDFEVVEHITNYCTYKDNESYKVDYNCEKNEVRNNIYKVKDSSGITFYVKKVNINENTNDYIDNATYDNYVTFNVVEKIEESFKPLFEIVGEIKELNLYSGIGVEVPDYKKENDKYIYYIIYQNLDRDTQSIVNKDMTIEEYISKLNSLEYSNIIKLHVRIDKDIDSTNFKEIVETIKENDFVNLNYGLEADTILFEFNNNVYIKYENGFTFELLKYEKNILEDEGAKVYDKKITMDYSDSDKDSIFYDDFVNLEKIDLNI